MTKEGTFHCTKCDLTWKDDYNEHVQRPRKTCPKCQKSCDLTNKDKIIKKVSNTIPKISPQSPQTSSGGEPSTSPLLDPEYYSNVNIKTLLKNSAINDILNGGHNKSRAWDLLSKSEFIEQGEIKHGVYWTSNMKPYHRPDFFYSNQNTAIEFMHDTHVMYQGGRQKIGKSTAAFNADFEDMLYYPGTVVTLVAPGLKQAAALLRQGFKEVLTLEDGTKFDLWNQLYAPYFIVDNVQTYIMKNGSRLQVIACSEHTTPGYATDVLHIEELDKIVKDPQALRGLGAVLPTVRARRDFARFRITCNNTAGIYRILREDLKHLYPWFVIYMEKPWNIATEKFTGEHIVYNEHYDCKKRPDIDEILKIIMDCTMGKAYTQQQLGNIDDYSGEVFNPDKVDLAYKKGKAFTPRKIYDNAVLAIDPGAIHNFAAGIFGIEGLELYHLWAEGFSISGKTPDEEERMLKKIAKSCAYAYIEHHCTTIVSESNSGARLIVPFIVHYIKKYLPLATGSSAIIPDVVWSNWGTDREQGYEAPRIISRVDYITLMQTIFDYGKITLQDRDEHEHLMRVEFARYKPQDSKEKYKGDFVDMTLHGVWELCEGFEYINRLIGAEDSSSGAILL
jgi:hypothetical protein